MRVLLHTFLFGLALILGGCSTQEKGNTLTFVTSAMYPPFEYKEYGELKGFDIDLASLIAKELGMQVKFIDTQFNTVLPTLQTGKADAAISTLTITKDRQQNFDFTQAYHYEDMAIVYQSHQLKPTVNNIKSTKIACELGSTMEYWLKSTIPSAKITAFDNNSQAIEALKAGHVDSALMDGAQGKIFSEKNAGLSYLMIAKSDDGYGIALKKDSPLLAPINQALKSLSEKGEIDKLKKKWLMDVPS